MALGYAEKLLWWEENKQKKKKEEKKERLIKKKKSQPAFMQIDGRTGSMASHEKYVFS